MFLSRLIKVSTSKNQFSTPHEIYLWGWQELPRNISNYQMAKDAIASLTFIATVSSVIFVVTLISSLPIEIYGKTRFLPPPKSPQPARMVHHRYSGRPGYSKPYSEITTTSSFVVQISLANNFLWEIYGTTTGPINLYYYTFFSFHLIVLKWNCKSNIFTTIFLCVDNSIDRRGEYIS